LKTSARDHDVLAPFVGVEDREMCLRLLDPDTGCSRCWMLNVMHTTEKELPTAIEAHLDDEVVFVDELSKLYTFLKKPGQGELDA
jgi:hypothetical protein